MSTIRKLNLPSIKLEFTRNLAITYTGKNTSEFPLLEGLILKYLVKLESGGMERGEGT